MNKLNLLQNKILSIALILVLTFLGFTLIPDDFKNAESMEGILYNIAPVFTIFFSGYAYVYGLKKIISKILFAILILITISNLLLYAYVLQLK